MEEAQFSPSVLEVESCVAKLLSQDNSGHDMSHIKRVLNLSLKFAEAANVDKDFVALIALLHDVDDYKLFGEKYAQNLTNAKRIMQTCNIDDGVQKEVEQSIRTIGYSKRLNGKMPIALAGKIVSDADMCDGLGAVGVIRVHSFGVKHNRPFFDRNTRPIDELNSDLYKNHFTDSSVCHYFEKILKLKDLMLTEPGRKEAEKRHRFTVKFLRQLFEEENAPEWLERLRDYEI